MTKSILQELAENMAARPDIPYTSLADAPTLTHLRDQLFAQIDPLLDGSLPSSLWVLVSPLTSDPLAKARRRSDAVPLPFDPSTMRAELFHKL